MSDGVMSDGQALDRDSALAIARAYLPEHWYGSRWHYHYTRSKLRSDPLYPGVIDALRGSSAPLLDLGCGIGLLAHVLRRDGIPIDYRGVDHDTAKIGHARRAAQCAGLEHVQFDVADLARALPAHRGSIAILDVLQYLDDSAQQRLLAMTIAMLAPGARLVIRTGIDDGDGRIRITRAIDRLGNRIGWMKGRPRRYPQLQTLLATLESAGLTVDAAPLRGNTPFNNWLIVARPR